MLGKRFSILVLLVIVSMMLASCGGEATPTTQPAAPTDTPAAAAPTAAPTEAAAAATDTPAEAAAPTNTTAAGGASGGASGSTTDYSKVGQELVDAFAGKYKGTKVTMFGPFGSEDEVKFNNSMKAFEDA